MRGQLAGAKPQLELGPLVGADQRHGRGGGPGGGQRVRQLGGQAGGQLGGRAHQQALGLVGREISRLQHRGKRGHWRQRETMGGRSQHRWKHGRARRRAVGVTAEQRSGANNRIGGDEVVATGGGAKRLYIFITGNRAVKNYA